MSNRKNTKPVGELIRHGGNVNIFHKLNQPLICLVSVMALSLLPNISSAAYSENRATEKSTEKTIDQNPLDRAGPYPEIDISSACSKTQSSGSNNSYQDVSEVLSLLNRSQSSHAAGLIREATPVFAWWLRSQQKISHVSIAVATHEATHWMKRKLTACFNGANAYYIDGEIFKTDLRQGESRHVSIALKSLPESYKARAPLRMREYLVESKRTPGNQFTALVDELVAYTGSAQVELAILKTMPSLLDDTEIRRFDGNLGGSSEMWLFCLAYLSSLREANEYEYQLLTTTSGLKFLLKKLWDIHWGNISETEQLEEKHRRILEFDSEILREIQSGRFSQIIDAIARTK